MAAVALAVLGVSVAEEKRGSVHVLEENGSPKFGGEENVENAEEHDGTVWNF